MGYIRDFDRYGNKIRVGDRVRVLEPAPSRAYGWTNSWDINMDAAVGRALRVESIYNNSDGIRLRLPDGTSYLFPSYCLAVVGKPHGLKTKKPKEATAKIRQNQFRANEFYDIIC